jgi:hypothetical protein
MIRELQVKTFIGVAAVLLCVMPQAAAAQTASAGKKSSGARSRQANVKAVRAPAASAVNDAETVESIYARHLAGMGGSYALSKIKSLIMRGHVQHSLAPSIGTFESYFKSPDRGLMVMHTPAGQLIEGRDGGVSWIQHPSMPAAMTTRRTTATFDLEAGSARSRQQGVVYKVKGKARVGDREADVVEALIPGGSTSHHYYDSENGLLLRVEATHVPPASEQGAEKLRVEVFFDRYAEVSGVKVPVKLRYVLDQKVTMTVSIYEVKPNVAISDALFASPVQSSKK